MKTDKIKINTISYVLCLGLLLTNAVIAPGTASAYQGPNLALGKTITASGYTQTYVAANANDGSTASYWEGAPNTYPSVLTVDLGSSKIIDAVVMKLNPNSAWGARTQTLSLQKSADNATYTNIAASTGYLFSPSSANTVTISFAATTARYVRLNITGNTGATAGQIAEFEVYGPGQPDLIVSDITYTPATPVSGNTVTLSAVVKNQGTAAGVAATVAFDVDGNRVAWSPNSTAAIAAGSTMTLSATTSWTATAGSHTITATADSSNITAESDETNNSFNKALAVNSPGTAKHEGESAALSAGAKVNTDHTGYTGTGFVDGYWTQGATTAFTVNASTAGNYDVTLRYANAMGNTRTVSIYVNGAKLRQASLPSLANWDTWGNKAETLSLNAGNNTIGFRYDPGDTGNINIDYITLTPSSTPSAYKFLIIVSNSMYKTGLITNALNTYKADADAAGWNSKIIKVSSTSDPTADHVVTSAAALKEVLRSYYNNGSEGFVFIGSTPDIPSAFWYDPSIAGSGSVPTDIFFADMDTVWPDPDSNGVYDLASFPTAEMFFGRITPVSATHSLTEEAGKVAAYLNKVHNYRINGSSLTLDQQNSMLLFDDDELHEDKYNVFDFPKVAKNIYSVFAHSLTNKERYISELKKGYRMANIQVHSDPYGHYFKQWIGDSSFEQTMDVSIGDFESINPKIHYINLFACGSTQFERWPSIPQRNPGSEYLFNSDYVLNVTGPTGNIWTSALNGKNYWSALAGGMPIGKAFAQYWINDDNHNNKIFGVLLGDPTLSYPSKIANKAPYITDILENMSILKPRIELAVGQHFNFSITDPEGDPIYMNIQGLPHLELPTTVSSYNWSWMPNADDIKLFNVVATLYNKDASGNMINKYVEEFQISVYDPASY